MLDGRAPKRDDCGLDEVGRGIVALTRLRTLAYGGTALSDPEALELLTLAGLDRVTTVATPHEAPAITVGHRPELSRPGGPVS